MKLYISGPMRGIPAFNFPAFDAARDALLAAGHEVFSPADKDRKQFGEKASQIEGSKDGNFEGIAHLASKAEIIRPDIEYILDYAEGIATLPGWENSKGAKAEVALGEFLGIPVDNVDVFLHPEQLAAYNAEIARKRAQANV